MSAALKAGPANRGARCQLGLHERQLAVDVGLHEAAHHLVGDAARDRPGKKGHRRRAHLVEDQRHHQRRHRRALGEMQPVGEAQAIGTAAGRAQCGVAGCVEQVFDDGAGFGHHRLAVADRRRLAQRVDGGEFGRRQRSLFVARIALDFAGHRQLFEQPEHALRARVLEVVDGQGHLATVLRTAVFAPSTNLRTGLGAARRLIRQSPHFALRYSPRERPSGSCRHSRLHAVSNLLTSSGVVDAPYLRISRAR